MCNFVSLLNLKLHIMKKLVSLLLVLLCTSLTMSVYAEEKTVDISIIDKDTDPEDKENSRPRNIIQDVIETTIDTDLGLLSLYFNENLANVTITVKNANGNIVASTTCNTSITTSTYLNVPTASGTYSIDIYGDCVTAYGEYDIN